jgi:hypothetical protein
LEIATYAALIEPKTGDLHVKMHSELSVRRLFGLSRSRILANYEAVFRCRDKPVEASHP